MYIKNRLLDELKYYEARVEETEQILKLLPEGKLTIAKGSSRKGFRWRRSITDKTGKAVRISIPQHEEALAADLAYRTFLEERMKDDLKAIKASRSYLRQCVGKVHGLPASNCLGEFGRLLKLRVDMTDDAMDDICREWLAEPYERYMGYPEQLIHPTLCGLMTRSKSESAICDALYSNNIPFKYEPVMYINGHCYAPDFMIMHPVTHEIYIWEHFGLMDKDWYRQNNRGKFDNYAEDGWILNINFIVTTETKTRPYEGMHANADVRRWFL